MVNLDEFFLRLWQQYVAITPQALAIQQLLEAQGETLINDHVAFRTLAHSHFSISNLEPQIFSLGYEILSDYHFEEKKLLARCYIHKNSPTKIFLSELLWKELSLPSQLIIQAIIDDSQCESQPSIYRGRFWSLPSYEDYQTLLQDSEYAAWFSIWGLRANHFTIYVNHLKKYASLEKVVELLNNNGYALNHSGGVIKGTPQDFLIQAATMADKQGVIFEDAGKQVISTCYYEFAQRFKTSDGKLYQGFVPKSADKIFESTNNNL
ncbi:MAG: DUF1338 domain-containing protein [Bermanella sp.]